MEMVIIAALILAAPFIAAFHFRRSAARLVAAEGVWESLERHGRVLLEDCHLNPRVGDLVEFVATHAGNGMLTRLFLLSLIWRPRSDESSAIADLRSLNEDQGREFMRFIVAALMYDSLRTALSGVVLRRVLYWLATTVRDEKAPVTEAQVKPAVVVAQRLCTVG